MANIEITLLLTKRTNIKTDGLNVAIATNRTGYTVVDGENNATTIQVNYFADYRNTKRYVHMKNSKGGYATLDFVKGESSITFKLPNTMTFAGNTVLTFFSQNDLTTTVWCPVIIPIIATGINYETVALCNKDYLIDSIIKSNKAITDSFQSLEASKKASEDVIELAKKITKKQGTVICINKTIKQTLHIYRQANKPGNDEWDVGDYWQQIIE